MKKILPESLLWKIAAIGIGLIVGVAITAIMTQLNFLFYPADELTGTDAEDVLKTYLHDPIMLSGNLIAIATGCFFAGAVAQMFFRYQNPLIFTYTGAVLMLLGVIDLITAPYPTWYWIASLILYIPATVAGAYFARYFIFIKNNPS